MMTVFYERCNIMKPTTDRGLLDRYIPHECSYASNYCPLPVTTYYNQKTATYCHTPTRYAVRIM